MKLRSLFPLLKLLKEFPGTSNTSKAELKSLMEGPEGLCEQHIKLSEELTCLRGIPKKFLNTEEGIKSLEAELELNEQLVALIKYLEPFFPDEDTIQNIYSLLLEADPTVSDADASFNQSIQAELFDYWLKQIRDSIQHEPNPITLLPLLEEQYGETPLKMACVITILLEQRLEPHSVSVNDIFQSGVLSRCFCIYTWTVNQKNELRQFYHWLENHRNESAVANLVAEAKHTLIPEEVKGTNPNLSLYGAPVENKDENNSPSKAIDPAQRQPFSFTETEENWETLTERYSLSFLVHALRDDKPSAFLHEKYSLLSNEEIRTLYEEISTKTAGKERRKKFSCLFYSMTREQILTIVESEKILPWIAFNVSSCQLSIELNEHQLERACNQPINLDELKDVLNCIQKGRIPRKYHQKLTKGMIHCLLEAPYFLDLYINNLDELIYLENDAFSKEYCTQRYQGLLADFLEGTEATLSIDGLTVDAYINIREAWQKNWRTWHRLRILFELEQLHPAEVSDLIACILEKLSHRGPLDIAASLEIFYPQSSNYSKKDQDTAKCHTLLACLKKNSLSSQILSFLKTEPSLKEKIFKKMIWGIECCDYVDKEKWKSFLDCAARISPPELLETILASLPERKRLEVLKIKKKDTSETILETLINHNKDNAIPLLRWLPTEQILEALAFKRDHHPTVLEQLIPSSNFSYRIVVILELLLQRQQLEGLVLEHNHHPTVLAAYIHNPQGYEIALSILKFLPRHQRLKALTFKRDNDPTILEQLTSSSNHHFSPPSLHFSSSALRFSSSALRFSRPDFRFSPSILRFSDQVVIILRLLPKKERFELLKQRRTSGSTILMELAHDFRGLDEVLRLLPQEDRSKALMERNNINQSIFEGWINNPEALSYISRLLTEEQLQTILSEKPIKNSGSNSTFFDHLTSSKEKLPNLLASLSGNNQLKILTRENSAHQTVLDQLGENPKLLLEVYFALKLRSRLAMLNTQNKSGKTVLSIIAANPEIQTTILKDRYTGELEKSRLVILLAIERYIQFRNTSSRGCGSMLTLFNPFSKGKKGLDRAKALKNDIAYAQEKEVLEEYVNEFLKGYTRFSSSSRYTDNSCASFLLAEFKKVPFLQKRFLSDIKLQFPEESKSSPSYS